MTTGPKSVPACATLGCTTKESRVAGPGQAPVAELSEEEQVHAPPADSTMAPINPAFWTCGRNGVTAKATSPPVIPARNGRVILGLLHKLRYVALSGMMWQRYDG